MERQLLQLATAQAVNWQMSQQQLNRRSESESFEMLHHPPPGSLTPPSRRLTAALLFVTMAFIPVVSLSVLLLSLLYQRHDN